MQRATEQRSRPFDDVLDRKEPEVRRDRLGRRINPKSLAALNAYKFRLGQSGNPGGNYKARPFTDAIAMVCEMKVSELGFKRTDPAPVAVVKAMFRAAIKGKVSAFAELANRLEGRPGQRMEFENVPGTALQVSSKIEVSSDDLVRTIREIYGLNDPESEKRRAQSSAPNRLI
jgi:Family of unknown function (DUF5681)